MTVFFDYSSWMAGYVINKSDSATSASPPYGYDPALAPEPVITHGYKMRARNAAGTAWVHWVVSATPDFAGTSAPEAVQVPTIVVATKWGDVPTVTEEVPALVPQTFNASGIISDPGKLSALILVRTGQGTWIPNGVITLPASPSNGADVTIKDVDGLASTAPIVVNGNSFLIDGSPTLTLNTNMAAARLVFNGSYWSVV